MDLQNALLKDHALLQMVRRQVSEMDVRQVLKQPESIRDDRPGRMVAQAIIGNHLIRVVVDIDCQPPEVVTVYRTSKIAKYTR